MAWKRLSKVQASESRYYANPILLNSGSTPKIIFSDRDSNNCSFIKMGLFNLSGSTSAITDESIIYFKDSSDYRENNGIIANSILFKNGFIELYCTSFHYNKARDFISSPLVLILDENTFKVIEKKYLEFIDDGIPKGCGSTFMSNDEQYMIFESRIQTDTQVSFELKMAKSKDGFDWEVINHSLVRPDNLSQYVSSPELMRFNNKYLVAYSLKNQNKYSIQFIESFDLKKWSRKAEMAFLPDLSGDWDNEQTCYPFIWKKSDNEIGLLYNGNTYGKNGLGVACWKI